MTTRRDFLTIGAGVAAFVAGGLPHLAAAQAAARVASISAMCVAPDGRLVVADWRNGALHALDLPSGVSEAVPFNLLGIDAAIAAAEGGEVGSIRATAAAYLPQSHRAVIAYTAGRGPDAPVRLAVASASGAVEILEPATLLSATLPLGDAPPDAAIWNRIPARSFLVTDVKPYGDELLVAGLANSDFSATLRRVRYPFTGGGVESSALEMYHTVHNQIETRAPVRAFAVVPLNGVDHLLAAYTCTPLVTAPMDALAEGAVVRAKTIAELGFGNTPLDIVPFSIDYNGEVSEWVIVANAAKSADLISLQAIAAANASEGISDPVKVPFETTKGVAGIQLPISNLVRLMDQDAQFLLALRRDPASGALELVSFRKGAFFRLSDFVNEYDFPTYDYPAGDPFQQDYIRPFHAIMKTDEGFTDLIE